MSDATTPLGGAAFDGFVTIREADLQGMVTFRGDLSGAKVKTAIKKVMGVALPEARQISSEGARAVAWMSPDELLLLMPHDQAEQVVQDLGAALKGQHHLAVNVSDARAMFRVAGAGARDVLAKLTPADMATLAPGEMRRSRLAQVAAAFWTQDGQDFTVIGFRSTARYVFDLLQNAAQPGSEVKYHH